MCCCAALCPVWLQCCEGREALKDIRLFITVANEAAPGSQGLHWSRRTASTLVGCFKALQATLRVS
jgi:hypothetical protein